MEQKKNFNYFYGTEADQFSFYRIPKALFKDDYFKNLSSDAKILYGLMLDRMSLSIKNQWFDDQNRAYGMKIRVTFFNESQENPDKGQYNTVDGIVDFYDPFIYLRIGDNEINIMDISEISGDIYDNLEQPC